MRRAERRREEATEDDRGIEAQASAAGAGADRARGDRSPRGALAAWALQNQASYFYAARATSRPARRRPARAVRLGGMVETRLAQEPRRRGDDRLHRQRRHSRGCRSPSRASSPTCSSRVSGVVAEGALPARRQLRGGNLLAKHDENYMPRELADMTDEQQRQTVAETAMIAEFGLAALWLAAALCRAAVCSARLLGAAARRRRRWRCWCGRPRWRRRCCVGSPSCTLMLAVRAHRPVGAAGRREQPFGQAADSTSSPAPGAITKARCCCGSRCWRVAGAAVALFERRLPERTLLATLGAQAFDRARFLRLPAVRLQSFRAARSRRRPRATGSTRCCRTPAWRSIRRRSTSAMSAFRSPSASRSARW